MFLVIGAILASGLFVGLLLYQLKFKRLIDLISYMPGPPALPLVGHGHHFIGKPPHEMVKKIFQFMEVFEKGSRDLLQNMERDRLKHGDAGFSLYDWINLCTMDTICGRNSKGSYFTGKQ